MEIPTLENLCVEKILRSNYQYILQLYSLSSYFMKNDWKLRCYEYISERFPLYLEKYGEDYLNTIIDNNDMKKMKEIYQQRLNIERKYAVKGTILEPRTNVSIEPSIDGYYPYDALKCGVAWPNNIDPTRREQYLSPTDFYEIFHMTKEEFATKDKYIRQRLKKEKELF